MGHLKSLRIFLARSCKSSQRSRGPTATVLTVKAYIRAINQLPGMKSRWQKALSSCGKQWARLGEESNRPCLHSEAKLDLQAQGVRGLHLLSSVCSRGSSKQHPNKVLQSFWSWLVRLVHELQCTGRGE